MIVAITVLQHLKKGDDPFIQHPGMLELIDNGMMGLRPAVELSYLTKEEQEAVLDQIEECVCTPSHAQAIRMRRLSENNILDVAAIKAIMKEEKPNQVEKIHVTYSKIKKYILRSVPFNKTEDYIIKALEFYTLNSFKQSKNTEELSM